MAAAAIAPVRLGIRATENSAASINTADVLNSIPLAHWFSGGPVFMRTVTESASDRVQLVR